MLNKNDPLIGAVQEVMKKNQAERDAVRLVNEKFGVTDRKALPHERQGEWDAAYKTVLTEGVEALDEAKKKSKLHPGLNTPESMKIRKIAGPGKVQYDPNDGVHIHDDLSDSVRKIRGFKVKDGKVKEIKGFVPGMREGVEILNELSPETLENYKNKRTTQVHAIIRNISNNWQRKRTPQGASDFIINSAEKAARHAERIKLAGDKIEGKKGVVAAKRPKKRLEEEELDEKLVGNQHRIDANKNGRVDGHDFKMLRAKKKPMEEDVTSPSSMGIKKPDYAPAGTTPDYAKPKEQTVNRAAKTSLPPGTMKEENLKEAGMMPTGVARKIAKVKAIVKGKLARRKANAVDATQSEWKAGHDTADRMEKIVSRLEEKKLTSAEKSKRKEVATAMERENPGMPMTKKMRIATETAKRVAEENEGFNNRHGLSVTASAEKQAVAELNERLVDNRQRTSRLAPMHTQGIKQTRARLAREPVEPKRSFSQKAAEFGRGVEATARGVAAGVTDLGQTSFGYKPLSDYALDAITPGRGEKLKQEFPTISNVSKDAASIASIATGAPGLVKGGLKYGAKKFIKSKADDLAKTTTALPKSTKPVSQAAREPAAVPTAAAKVASKPAKPVSQAAREPDEIIMPAKKPDIPSGNAGIRGTFQDKLARARQNAGSDLKARQLPALRRTTEPTKYVRPGVPAVRPTSGPNLPARPGSPNLAAGGATRIVGLSDKAKAGLAAGAAGAAIGGYALNRSLSGNQPPAAQASTTPVAPANAASPQAMAAGAERDKVGVKRIQPVTATTQSVPVPKPKPVQTQAQPQVTKKSNALQQQMARSKSGRDEPAGPRKDAQGLNVHSMTRPQPGKPGVRK